MSDTTKLTVSPGKINPAILAIADKRKRKRVIRRLARKSLVEYLNRKGHNIR